MTADSAGYWLVASDGGHLRLRRRRLLRLDRRHPSSTSRWSGMAATPERRRLLAGGVRRRDLRLRRRRLLRLDGRPPAQPAGRRDGRHPRRKGLLAGGRRRRHLRLRRRPVLRVDRQPHPQPAHRGDGRQPRTGTATGSPPPTAGSSPSATRGSSGRSAACPRAGRSWRWPRPPTGRATGSPTTTARSPPTATRPTGARHPRCSPNRWSAWPRRPATATSPRSPYPSGSFGYDISNFQCGGFPPPPHTIGIVQVVGESMGGTNPCLAQRGGLGRRRAQPLHLPHLRQTSQTSADPACNATAAPPACHYGFLTALDAFSQGGERPASTPRWPGGSTSRATRCRGSRRGRATSAANAALVAGCDRRPALRRDSTTWASTRARRLERHRGRATSRRSPYWAAAWEVDPATTCANVRSQFPGALLPTGPVQIVQYSSPQRPAAARRR